MLKLVSDPTVSPIREISLLRSGATDGSVICTPRIVPRSSDIVLPTPKGARVRTALPAVNDIELHMDYLTHAQYLQLRRWQEEGSDVYVFPNFDANTRLWAPLTASTKCLKKSYATDLLVKSDAGVSEDGDISNNVDRWYTDDNGVFQKVLSTDTKTSRYMASHLGRGIIVERAWGNEVAVAHPVGTSPQNLIWAAGTGSPTVAWTDEIYSPYVDAAGCTKVGPTSGAFDVTHTVTGLTFTTVGSGYQVEVYARGRGVVTLKAQFAPTSSPAGAVQSDSAVTLKASEWTKLQYYVENDVAGASDVELTLECAAISGPNDGLVYLGPIAVYATGGSNPCHFQHWNESGKTGSEFLDYYNSSVQLFPVDDFTVMACGLLPTNASMMDLVNTGGAAGFQFYINTTGVYFEMDGNTVTQSISGWASKEGLGFWALARKNSAGSMTVAIKVAGDATISSTDNSSLTGLDDTVLALPIRIGHAQQQDSAMGLIQHVRIDNKSWTTNEVQASARMFTDDVFRNVITYTQGRKYRVAAEALQPRKGNWDQMVGPVLFEELAPDTDFVIA